MEETIPTEKGEAIPAGRDTAVQLPGVPPRRSRILGYQLDISKQKKAEEDQAWLATIVESSEDAIISKSLEGIVTSWNEGAWRLFGYSAEEMLGQPVSRIIPPERFEEEEEILARLRRGERLDHYETVCRHKDGRLVDVFLSISPIRDSSGRIIGASKIARDITEQKKAEAAMKQAHERLQEQAAVLELAPVLVRDMDSRIVLWTRGPSGSTAFRRRKRWAEFHTSCFRPSLRKGRSTWTKCCAALAKELVSYCAS
jgi:PAS domain S-box-containing protein